MVVLKVKVAVFGVVSVRAAVPVKVLCPEKVTVPVGVVPLYCGLTVAVTVTHCPKTDGLVVVEVRYPRWWP